MLGLWLSGPLRIAVNLRDSGFGLLVIPDFAARALRCL
jgi:hypothetical protein